MTLPFLVLGCDKSAAEKSSTAVKGEAEVAAAPEPSGEVPALPAATEAMPVEVERLAEPRVEPAPFDEAGVEVAPPVPPPSERIVEPEEAKAERLIRQLSNYMMGVSAELGRAPADLEEAREALHKSHGIQWPVDPWGTPYQYQSLEGRNFRIFSAGPDGIVGSEDDLRLESD